MLKDYVPSRSIVPSTVVLMLGSIPGFRWAFVLHLTIFYRLHDFRPFTVRPSHSGGSCGELITFLHLVGAVGAGCQMGSHQGRSRRPKQGACFVFLPSKESIPRYLHIYSMENSVVPSTLTDEILVST